MRNAKELAKSGERKATMASKKSAKTAPVKVVDVKLTPKAKQQKQDAVRGRKVVAASEKSDDKRSAKKTPQAEVVKLVTGSDRERKALPKKGVTAAKPESAKVTTLKAPVAKKKDEPRQAPKAVEPAKSAAAPPPAPILTPSPEILRPFRDAAKKNRQLARELERHRGNRSSFLAKPVKKGKKYAIDLRVHSPGTVGYFSAGGIDPGPALIRLAGVKGLDIIALTDFYNAAHIDVIRNSPGAANVNRGNLTILPAFDICCQIGNCREVYGIVLFPEETPSATLFEVLSRLGVPRSAFGRRDYVLSLSFDEVLAIVEGNGGVLIPSRVDKTPYRQLAIPVLVERYGMRAFDLAHPDSPEFFWERWPRGGFTFFHFSNANALGQIGSRCGKVKLSQPGFAGIKEIVQRRLEGSVENAG